MKSLEQEESIAWKNKTNVWKYIFVLQFGTFWAFLTCLNMLCIGVGVEKFWNVATINISN